MIFVALSVSTKFAVALGSVTLSHRSAFRCVS